MNTSATSFTRRGFLTALGAGTALGVIVPPFSGARPAAVAATTPTPAGWSSSRSANGWSIGAPSATFRIEGTNHDVTLAIGLTATILLHAARRFNYELDTLRTGDVSGLSTDRDVLSPERSNILSGTAILIRPDSFPYGTSGNLFPDEIVVLEDIVAETGGVLAWGGHLHTPDQGLLYIDRPPSSPAVQRLARVHDETDGMSVSGGAGQIDAFDADRRREADRHRRRQGGG